MLAPLDAGPLLTPAGERLVTAASELFYRRGIRAVGVDLIAEAAGTTKKTLYDRFGSKDELVAVYLCRRAHRWQLFLLDRLARLDHSPPGPDRVLAPFDALREWMTANDRGCAFVNAWAEIGGTDHPGTAVIRAEKEWMRELFAVLVDDPHRADQVHLLYEGVIVVATAGARPGAHAAARDGVARLLSP